MSRPPVSRIRRDTQINIKQRYIQAYKKYISSQFTYNSHSLLKKLCQNGQKQPSLYNVPLYKMMIEITKIMMMNELQLLFFGATVQEMGWKKVDEACLTPYVDEVSDITPKIGKKDTFVKKMQLSLLLIAYIVKIYLNEQSSLYDYKIRELAKSNFQKMYQQWVQKVQNHFKFSPKNMNKLFKQLDKGKSQVNEQIVNYNLLVSQLFKNQPEGENEQKEYYSGERYHHNVSKEKHQESYPSVPVHRVIKKIEGLPVHQEEEELIVPQLNGRTSSIRSHVSGLGKRESYHQLFEKGEFKNQRVNSLFPYPQDEDFL